MTNGAGEQQEDVSSEVPRLTTDVLLLRLSKCDVPALSVLINSKLNVSK